MTGNSNEDKTEHVGGTLQLLKSFLTTTTVKGIPKIILAKTRCLSMLWLTTFVFGALVGGYFVDQLLQGYFNHEVIIITSRIVSPVTFPEITICNLNPLANLPLTKQEIDNITSSLPQWANNSTKGEITKYTDIIRNQKFVF